MSQGKQPLFQELEAAFKYVKRPEIPNYITDNLRYELFDWQKRAIANFLFKVEYKSQEDDTAATHFLFNMATGTGKTLVMAALILYYYKQGYRHFIFFVNQSNIVGKTEENLANPNHGKYLFNKNIVIDNKVVRLRKVENFSDGTDDIQVLFTTVHKLHNAVYLVKENGVYLEDLQKRDLIMLGDEAHHLNADTKKKKNQQTEFEGLNTELSDAASEEDIEKSWEDTICRKILEKGKSKEYAGIKNKNVLLEFTATVPKDTAVTEKYQDKIIFKFDLVSFLNAGYTKEINLVTSTAKIKQIIIQALLFNWYRYKIALDNGLQNFKPVILFRSKKIDDSKQDFKNFLELIQNLTIRDFDFLKEIKDEETADGQEIYLKGKSRLVDIKHFISEKGVELLDIIAYLQYNFDRNHCIVTNSEDKAAKGKRGEEKTTEEQDRLLNSLEERSNKITAIFTVQRLNEGWDVLNLFDIVRLYESRDESKTKSGERRAGAATVSEVQLIGRGVRYYPFDFQNKNRLKRKFDDDLEHEMRVLEEFYFHSYDDDKNRYIDELKRELKSKGYIDDSRKSKTFRIKKSFKEDNFYKTVKLWLNDRKKNPNARKFSLKEMENSFEFSYKIDTIRLHEEGIILDKDNDKEKYTSKKENQKTLSFKLKEFPRNVLQKAINIRSAKDNSLLRFEKLKEELQIDSMDNITDSNFFGDFPINIIVPKAYDYIEDLPKNEQLNIMLGFLERIEALMKESSNPYIGSEFRQSRFNSLFEEPVVKLVTENEESKKLEMDLIRREWYVLDSFSGTSEEIGLIDFFKTTLENLKDKYEKVYLLRNEEVYTIYDFATGRGFQPDFLLFLQQRKKNKYYQVFIEPKGDQFKDNSGSFTDGGEGWKEHFLKEISNKYVDSGVLKFENREYKLIGLPLFNEKLKSDFRKKYNELLELD